MGHKHSRESLLAAAVDVAELEGLHRLSFGRVAARAGTSDRVVVYYFTDKQTLVADVLGAIGAALLEGLAPGLDGVREPDHVGLAARLWPGVRGADAQRAIAVYVEALGLAAAGTAPYARAAATVAESWVEWFTEHLEGSPEHRRSQARAALALVDGLLLLRLVAGPEAAEDAARALGVT